MVITVYWAVEPRTHTLQLGKGLVIAWNYGMVLCWVELTDSFFEGHWQNTDKMVWINRRQVPLRPHEFIYPQI